MNDISRQDRINILQKRALSIKRRFLRMYHAAHAGHVGCSLSCAEILTFLHFSLMRSQDQLILSKGHAAAALYSLLAEADIISENQISTFYQDGTLLAAHPPFSSVPGITFATGSLGHGLSLSAGLAKGARLLGQDELFLCVTSDGELNEGSVWEAVLFARQHHLSNLIWFIDRNYIQGFGRTEEVIALEPLSDKLRAFGWFVMEANGHDFESLLGIEEQIRNRDCAKGQPIVVVCKTVKGHGLSALADTVDCHYLPMTEEQYKAIMTGLDEEDARNRRPCTSS